MKRVIVQIMPADAPASDDALDSSGEESARQEVIPISGVARRSENSGEDSDSLIRVEAVVSAERARSVVDSVLNVSERTSVDSFEQLVELLIEREFASDDSGQLFHRIMSSIEKALVEKAFFECGQVQTRTAERLGVNRNTIHKKLLKHELLDPEDEESSATSSEAESKRRCV